MRGIAQTTSLIQEFFISYSHLIAIMETSGSNKKKLMMEVRNTMKKTIAAFVLGGVITAGAFGISYGLPITSAAEKAAAAKPAEEMAQQCTNTTKSSDSKNIMNSMMADPKATDPKAIEDMTKQCTEMMKNPEMQTMMNTAKTDEKLAGEDSHTAHHQ